LQWDYAQSGYDELFEGPGRPRPHYDALLSVLQGMSEREIARRERLQRVRTSHT